jgi:hypothetical protein
MFERSVISALSVTGETAAGQLPAGQMITQAIATISFARTGFITAIAFLEILLGFTFHRNLLIQYGFTCNCF